MSRLTDEEKIILKNTDKQYKYIARDGYGGLYLYASKPHRKKAIKNRKGFWISYVNFCVFSAFNHLFQDIRWKKVRFIFGDAVMKKQNILYLI